MDEILIAAAAGAVFSFLLVGIPGLSVWWANLAGNTKRWGSLALSVAVAFVGVGAACAGYDLHFGAVCPPGGLDAQSVIDLLVSACAAYLGSQGAYGLVGIKLKEHKERLE